MKFLPKLIHTLQRGLAAIAGLLVSSATILSRSHRFDLHF